MSIKPFVVNVIMNGQLAQDFRDYVRREWPGQNVATMIIRKAVGEFLANQEALRRLRVQAETITITADPITGKSRITEADILAATKDSVPTEGGEK